MIDMFASFDKKRATRKKVLFITLTYQWRMTDYITAKRDLKVFVERVQESFPDAWIVWKMEEQKSGSIHFHLMVGNVGFMKVQEWQTKWNAVSGQTARNSLDLDVMRSYKGIMSYVSKYLAKPCGGNLNAITKQNLSIVALLMLRADEFAFTVLMGLSMSHILSNEDDFRGRYWGSYGKKNLPMAEKETRIISVCIGGLVYACARLHERYAMWWQNFTVYTDNAMEEFLKFIDDLYKRGKVPIATVANHRYVETLIQINRDKAQREYASGVRIRKKIEDDMLWQAWRVANGKPDLY